MYNISKVTPDEQKGYIPIGLSCLPNTIIECAPSKICLPQRICTPHCIPNIVTQRNVSGTYISRHQPSLQGTIVELRVDVDGRRPQNRISGDNFSYSTYLDPLNGIIKYYTQYSCSFVIESMMTSESSGVLTLAGPIKYYNDASKTGYTIEVTIPRVNAFSAAADATVKFYNAGVLESTFICPKISEFFRTVELEIDCLQGTKFPPTAHTCVNPHPADLTCEDLTCADIYQRAGINMTVTEDDILNDPDNPTNPDGTWSNKELHDLMVAHFDHFANTLQWNCYGVIVPKLDSGNYGIMFDWSGGQPGDTYFRQGAAIAHDSLRDHRSGTLYNDVYKKARLLLWCFVHEIGHAFNLPHTWARSENPNSASQSFMNYPWAYTGGVGGESAFWSNFRWEFDDVELIWMRHADRNDVIFGGRDWIWNNLCIYSEPQIENQNPSMSLEVRTQEVFDFAQPVRVELKLKNISDKPQKVDSRLEPEDSLVTLYITRPNSEIVSYIPPVRRDAVPRETEVAAGESIYESVMLSYGAKGAQFQQPGEYIIRAYYNSPTIGTIVSQSCRFRVAVPFTRNTEELAYLLFSPEAAKFLYLGGTERYPQVTAKLKEAVKTYAKSDPAVVRNIAVALGTHASEPFKQVVQKDGKKVVTLRKANLNEAIKYLETARELLPERKISALDNITYNRLSMRLADCYLKQEKKVEAEQTLKESMQYLQRRQVVNTVIADYSDRIKKLSTSD